MGKACSRFHDDRRTESRPKKKKGCKPMKWKRRCGNTTFVLDEIETITVNKYRSHAGKTWKERWKNASRISNTDDSTGYDSDTSSIGNECYDHHDIANVKHVDDGYHEQKYRERTLHSQKNSDPTSKMTSNQTSSDHPFPDDYFKCLGLNITDSEFKATDSGFQSTDSGFKSEFVPSYSSKHSSWIRNAIPDGNVHTPVSVDDVVVNNALDSAHSQMNDEIDKNDIIQVLTYIGDQVHTNISIHGQKCDNKYGSVDEDSGLSSIESSSVQSLHEHLTIEESDNFRTLILDSFEDTTDTMILKRLAPYHVSVESNVKSMDSLGLTSSNNESDTDYMNKPTTLGMKEISFPTKYVCSMSDEDNQTHYPRTLASGIRSWTILDATNTISESSGTFPKSDFSDSQHCLSFNVDSTEEHSIHIGMISSCDNTLDMLDTDSVSGNTEAIMMFGDFDKGTHKSHFKFNQTQNEYNTANAIMTVEMTAENVNEVNVVAKIGQTEQLNYVSMESQTNSLTDEVILHITKGNQFDNGDIATNEKDIVEAKSVRNEISNATHMTQVEDIIMDKATMSNEMLTGSFSNTCTITTWPPGDKCISLYNICDDKISEEHGGCILGQHPIVESEPHKEISCQGKADPNKMDAATEKEVDLTEELQINVSNLIYIMYTWYIQTTYSLFMTNISTLNFSASALPTDVFYISNIFNMSNALSFFSYSDCHGIVQEHNYGSETYSMSTEELAPVVTCKDVANKVVADPECRVAIVRAHGHTQNIAIYTCVHIDCENEWYVHFEELYNAIDVKKWLKYNHTRDCIQLTKLSMHIADTADERCLKRCNIICIFNSERHMCISISLTPIPETVFIGAYAKATDFVKSSNIQPSVLPCATYIKEIPVKNQHDICETRTLAAEENTTDVIDAMVADDCTTLHPMQPPAPVNSVGFMTDSACLEPETLIVSNETDNVDSASADDSQTLLPENTSCDNPVTVKDNTILYTSHTPSLYNTAGDSVIDTHDRHTCSDLNKADWLTLLDMVTYVSDTDNGSLHEHDTVTAVYSPYVLSEQKKKPRMKRFTNRVLSTTPHNRSKNPIAELNSSSVDSGVYSTMESLSDPFGSLLNEKRQLSKICRKFNKKQNKKAHRQTHNRLTDLKELTKGISRQWYRPVPNAVPQYIVNTATGLDSYFERLRNGETVSIQEQMQYHWMRLNSFGAYSGNGNSIRLARAGFYLNPNSGDQETICFACGFRYSTWQYFDNVDEIHRRHSPSCPHVRGETATSRNIPIDVSTVIPTATATSVAASTTHGTPTGSVTVASSSETTSSESDVTSPATSLSTQQGSPLPSLAPTSMARIPHISQPSVASQPTDDVENRSYVATFDSQSTRSLVPPLPGTSSIPVVMMASLEHGNQTTASQPSEPSAPRPRTSDTASATQPGAAGVNDPNAIHVDNPKHPAYVSLDVRMMSFSGWPSYLDQTPLKMAEAGFFYPGTADFARCFCCGGGLRNWEPGDNPLVEHTRWFPQCEYVTKLKGTAFTQAILRRQKAHLEQQQREATERARIRAATPVSDPLTSETGVQLLDMGYEGERVNEAVLAVRQQKGRSLVTVEEVLSWILDEEDRRRAEIRRAVNLVRASATATATTTASKGSSSTSGTAVASRAGSASRPTQNITRPTGAASPTVGPIQGATGNGDAGSKKKHGKKKGKGVKSGDKTAGPSTTSGAALLPRAETVDTQSLEAENQKLREMQICKICMDKPVNVTFLPCGHLVCCQDCAPTLRICPICRMRIKGRVKTFMS